MFSFLQKFLLIFFLSFTVVLFAQNSIKEKEYTITYTITDVQLVFDIPVSVKAFDAFTNNSIPLEQNSSQLNAFDIKNFQPAQIIQLQYYFLYGDNYDMQTSYFATPSLSTGTIDVFFNHPVDISFAQTQNAINLSNTLDNKLISYINACSTTLDIAIYNSYSPSATSSIAGAINAAYTRGVQVRVIYDGSTSSSMISLLNAGIPKVASPTAVEYSIMHNKFVVFDANLNDANKPLVWTGSTNWTTSQIDGPDRNNAIVIQDQALALGYTLEFNEMWGSSTMVPNATLSKFGPYKTDNTPHHYTIGGKTIDSYFSPSDGVNAKIIAAINSANVDIDIATMLITRSDIRYALLNKYNSGLTNINVLVDSQVPTGNQFYNIQAGILPNHAVQYSTSSIMHHKFMVVDNFNSSSDPLVVLGSHNWSSSAETKNDENTLIVHDTNIANQYYQAFAYLYQQSGGIINLPLATNTIEQPLNTILIYPNPTNGILHFQSIENDTNFDLKVQNLLGNTISTQHLESLTNSTVDLSREANGIYFITLTSPSKHFHYKVVKN
jgi:phosphatidylserine/phosphatidylglycerophosphate/cardiolipin synthase-like enzyme